MITEIKKQNNKFQVIGMSLYFQMTKVQQMTVEVYNKPVPHLTAVRWLRFLFCSLHYYWRSNDRSFKITFVRNLKIIIPHYFLDTYIITIQHI